MSDESMAAYARRCQELREALNRVRSEEDIRRGVDHTKIQGFDFDGNLIESITPRSQPD